MKQLRDCWSKKSWLKIRYGQISASIAKKKNGKHLLVSAYWAGSVHFYIADISIAFETLFYRHEQFKLFTGKAKSVKNNHFRRCDVIDAHMLAVDQLYRARFCYVAYVRAFVEATASVHLQPACCIETIRTRVHCYGPQHAKEINFALCVLLLVVKKRLLLLLVSANKTQRREGKKTLSILGNLAAFSRCSPLCFLFQLTNQGPFLFVLLRASSWIISAQMRRKKNQARRKEEKEEKRKLA